MINCNIGYVARYHLFILAYHLYFSFMLRDPRVWGPDADTFRPERFLGEEAKNLPDISSIPFGFGNRYALSVLVPCLVY